MFKGIAVSGAALALAAGSVTPAAAAALDGPSGVKIEVASSNGSGCPKGTAKANLSSDAEAFSVSYSDYTAQVGGSAKPADARKNCRISLQVLVPADYTYAISSVDYRTHVSLQAGAKGSERAEYYFQGDTETGHGTHDMTGPVEDNWQFSDVVPKDQLKWKPCGQERNFNINSELRVDKGTSDAAKVSLISMSPGIGSPIVYHLAWQKC
ncbi:DUF4360 domain-containing protein [Actinomadura meridiana]|uniref:DUF4360 domain-containing protein n=1 Tax=Actinomadura meridiana TaxID=559626 RepID=A0ABP8C153_9ACTN